MSDEEVISYDDTEYGIQLCKAVKSHKCLYDRGVIATKPTTTAAWKAVAKRCNDQVGNCRFRWKTLRNNFTRSYKKFGDKSNYYLHPHLIFLIPHLDVTPDNDDDSLSASVASEGIKSPLKTNVQNNKQDGGDNEITMSADESHSIAAASPGLLKYDTGETLPDKQQQVDAVDQKDLDMQTIEKNPRHVEFQLNKTPEEVVSLETVSRSTERRLRDRKVPKRFIDADFSPDVSNEKRSRRSTSRRKSAVGLALKDLEFESTMPDILHTPDNKIFNSTKSNSTPTTNPEIISGENAGKQHSKVNSFIQDDEAMEKPLMVDSFSNTEKSAKYVNVSTQCEILSQGADDAFLDALKPEMSAMNLRQKVHFKRRIFHALMDVLDDGTNFPNDNEIVKAASSVSASYDLKSTTSSELKLIRELVSIVQAAKCTPELKEIERNKSPEFSKLVSTSALASNAQPVTSPQTATQFADKQTKPSGGVIYKMMPISPLKLSQQSSNVSTPVSAGTALASPMIIKRKTLPKTVEITGSNGCTVVTQDGETRRIIRLFPSNASAKSLPPPSPKGTPASTTYAAVPSTSQQSTQPSTTSVNVPSTRQQPFTSQKGPQQSTTNDTLSSSAFQRPQQSTTNGTLSSSAFQRPQPSATTNASIFSTSYQRPQPSPTNASLLSTSHQRSLQSTTNSSLLSTSQKKTPQPLGQIPNSSASSGLKMPPNRNTASSVKHNPYLAFVANRDGYKQKSMLPPSVNSVMSPARSIGGNKPNTTHKIISRRYSICGPVSSKHQPMSTQNRLPNPPFKRIVRTPPPLQKIPPTPMRDEFHLLLHQLPSHAISEGLTAPSTTLTNTTNTSLPIGSRMRLSSPISLYTDSDNSIKNQPAKHIPAINYNCRPRMSEPLPQPVNAEASPISDALDATDYLTPSEASLLEMAGTVAADNFGLLFDAKSIKDEPEY